MKVDELIHRLSSELTAVKRQPNPGLFAAQLMLASLGLVSICILAISFRPDITAQFYNISFLLLLIISLGVSFSSLVVVARLTHPGTPLTAWPVPVTVCLLSAFFVWNAHTALSSNTALALEGLNTNGALCSLITFLLTVFIGVLVTYFAQKRVPVKPLLTGLAIVLASFGAASVGIAFHCENENGLHLAVWHFFLPLLAGTGFGAIIGRNLLRL